MGLNTGPVTLDPAVGPLDNDASWSQFANLLYIDAPGTGFSYTLPQPSGAEFGIEVELNRDAATFVRVVLGFMARHPQIEHAQVVLVGQSYGGSRATRMLQHLLFHDELVDSDYVDSALRDAIVAHFDRIDAGGPYGPQRVAEQFSAVLVQPNVACERQRDLGDGPFEGDCRATHDEYQCDEQQLGPADTPRSGGRRGIGNAFRNCRLQGGGGHTTSAAGYRSRPASVRATCCPAYGPP